MKSKYLFITLSYLFFLNNVFAQHIYENERAPEFALYQLYNNNDKIELEKGKPIILEFWATWCASCIKVIPHMNELAKHYTDKITFVAVNSYDTESAILEFLKKNEIKTLIGIDKEEFLKKKLEVQIIPVTILVDKNGFLRWKGLANELTTNFLDVFLAENRILDYANNTKIIDTLFSVNSIQESEVKFNVQRSINEELTQSTSSVNIHLQDSFLIALKNYPITTTIHMFLGLADQSVTEPVFKGKIPEHNIDLFALSNSIGNEQLILKQLLDQFSEKMNFSIDTTIVQKKEWALKLDQDKLRKQLSANQDKKIEIEEKRKCFQVRNISLIELTKLLTSITEQEITCNCSKDTERYDLKIKKIKHIAKIDSSLKDKYGIKIYKKEIEEQVISVEFY